MRRTWKARRLLRRLRGAEVAKVFERVMVGVTTLPQSKADENDTPTSFDDVMAEYVKVFGMPRQGDPWLLVLRCLERVGMLEARELVRAMDAEVFGAVSASADKDSKRRMASLHKWLHRQAYPKVVTDDA